MSGFLGFLKTQWALLAEIATWILFVIGGFWRQPPPGTPQASSQLGSFGQFFLTLAVGLLTVPALRYRQSRHVAGWLVAALALFVLAPVPYFLYEKYTVAWTCSYSGGLVVCGSDADLTEHGTDYKGKNPNLTDAQIVWNHTGEVEEVWRKESIESRRLKLAIFYVALMPLFAASIISVIQALYCQMAPISAAAGSPSVGAPAPAVAKHAATIAPPVAPE